MSNQLVSQQPQRATVITSTERDEEHSKDEDATEQQPIMEVNQHTKEHLLRSFISMKDVDRRQLDDSFALPKVAVTKTSLLDAVVLVQCLKTPNCLASLGSHSDFEIGCPCPLYRTTRTDQQGEGDNIRPGGLYSGVCHHPPE